MTEVEQLQAATNEVVAICLETSLPRLSVLLLDLGHADLVPDVLALQSTILGVIAPPSSRRRVSRRRKK